MAEVKNSFLKSKMNKDLDSRLLPNGEYRDAVNIQVIKSESEDVGALENVLGNENVGNFVDAIPSEFSLQGDLFCVGHYVDQNSGNVYLFFTDYIEGPNRSTKYQPSANNFIFRWSPGGNVSGNIKLLVYGAFLNFHPKFPIIGVNLLEQLLFFTDNRNQPRKINVEKALDAPGYYTTEDQISVAKYNPYRAIEVYKPSTVSLEYNGSPVQVTIEESLNNGINAKVVSIPVDNSGDALVIPGLAISSTTYIDGELNQIIVLDVDDSENIITLNQPVTLDAGAVLTFNYIQTSMLDVVSDDLPDGTTNPFKEPAFPGDPNFLEDKFVKFSYRFKFDDGEYSILAPFTQACFVPKQDGYFLGGDEKQTFSSTIVDFAKNKINKINLQIPLPDRADNIENSFKISELDIIYKESDALAVQVVETISVSKIAEEAVGSTYFSFDYVSTKPYKTLPESELVRVYDKTPVKAFSQEVSGNRVIYGNFQDKHTPPAGLDYQVSAGRKLAVDDVGSNLGIVEYPSSNVKENRNYQIGVVLSDRFGRQSTVILSSNKSQDATGAGFKADTVYLPYSFRDASGAEIFSWNFLGNSLKVQFNSDINGDDGPGLYNSDVASEDYNPLGWYSYKIVVKQVEQDYYNVYTAGAMKDIPFNYVTKLPPTTAAPFEQNTSFITLLNDNINKVPRDLTEVGPQDKTFRSSVKLYGRVMNNTNTYSVTGNEQFSQLVSASPGSSEFTTNNIEDLFDLFDVAQFEDVVDQNIFVTSALSPYYSFYKADSNPFIVEFVTSQDTDLQFGVNNEFNTITKGDATVQNSSDTTIDLSGLSSGLEISPGQLVTASSGIEPETYVVSFDPTTVVLTVNKAQPNLSNGTVLTFSAVEYLKIENLAVLETAPTVSKLDIFWETTSSGLISDLNKSIEQGTDGASGIENFDFFCPEDITPGEDLISAENNPNQWFYFIDKNGNEVVTIQNNGVTLYVTDGKGNSLTGASENRNEATVNGFFRLERSGSKFRLKVDEDSYFYYYPDEDGKINPLNRFKFTFKVVTTGGVENFITPVETSEFPFQVTNKPPIINLPGDRSVARSYTSTEILRLTEVFNGSSDPQNHRRDLTWSQPFNIKTPSSQTHETVFSLETFANKVDQTPNATAVISQPSKTSVNAATEEEPQPNFGTYSYDITVTDGGGLSTTINITQHICIPSMVDYMSFIHRNGYSDGSSTKTLYQGEGSVEFFADSLDDLNSTDIVPESFQQGYTIANLNNETNDVVEGRVCTEEDARNDAMYYARAFKSKPLNQPSSTFYVLASLLQNIRREEQPNSNYVDSAFLDNEAGVFAAIQYRENVDSPWVVAKDVFGEDCVYGNLYDNKVEADGPTTMDGKVILAGMTIDKSQNSNFVNRLVTRTQTEAVNLGQKNRDILVNETVQYVGMSPARGGRIFVLNNPGDYRIQFGNIYNDYSAFKVNNDGEGYPVCGDFSTSYSQLSYEIGDFTNVAIGSRLRGELGSGTIPGLSLENQALGNFSNIYTYQYDLWAKDVDNASCPEGLFQGIGLLYSASPSARYLYAPNKTQIDRGLDGDTGSATISDEIFGLFYDKMLTRPFEKGQFYESIKPSKSKKSFTRIRRLDGNPDINPVPSNPESTRDGTYLLVIDPAGLKRSDIYVSSPCLDCFSCQSDRSASSSKSLSF